MPITQDRFIRVLVYAKTTSEILHYIHQVTGKLSDVYAETNAALSRTSDPNTRAIIEGLRNRLVPVIETVHNKLVELNAESANVGAELQYFKRHEKVNKQAAMRAYVQRRQKGVPTRAEYVANLPRTTLEDYGYSPSEVNNGEPSTAGFTLGITPERVEEARRRVAKSGPDYVHGKLPCTPDNPYGFELDSQGKPYDPDQWNENFIAEQQGRAPRNVLYAKYAQIGVYPRDFSQVIAQAQSSNPQASPTQAPQANPNHMPKSTSEPKLYVDPPTGEPEPRLVKREGEIIGEYSSEPKKLFPGAIFGKPPVSSTSEPELKPEATNEPEPGTPGYWTEDELRQGRTEMHEKIWKNMTNSELLNSFRNNMSLWPGLTPESALAVYLEQFRNKDEDGTGKSYAADLL